jgi:hypothetical protein
MDRIPIEFYPRESGDPDRGETIEWGDARD